MKKISKYSIALALTLCTLTTSVSINRNPSTFQAIDLAENATRSLKDIKEGYIRLPGGMKFHLNHSLAGVGGGDSSCSAITTSAWSVCNSMWSDSSYLHGALKYFNNTLCWLNKGATSEIEKVLCHFDKSMGLKPNLSALPQTITQSFGEMTVSILVNTPTESWATTAGYLAKAIVSVNGINYMVLYWGGSGTSSKGFLIEGNVNGLGGKRAGYVKWDLTDPKTETVQVLNADFPSGTYLSSTATGDRGDHAVYGRVTFDAVTSAVETQAILIAKQRGGSSSSLGCFKMYAKGIKGGQMVIAKTESSLGSIGHAVTYASKNLSEMDGVNLIDAATTANGTGNIADGSDSGTDVQAELETALSIITNQNVFDKSCGDLNSAGSSGVFSTTGTMVDFSHSPANVF